jgi:hypothetical protein
MEELALFPLNTVLFPNMPLALHIFEERYKLMIGRCVAEAVPFGVVLIREGRGVGTSAVPFAVGTTAHIINVERLDEGRMNLICVGRQRFRLHSVTQRTPYLIGRVAYEPHEFGARDVVYGVAAEVRQLFADYLRVLAAIVEVELNFTALPPEADSLAYGVVAAIQIENVEKQHWLENDSVQQILQDEAQRLPKEIVRLKLLGELEKEHKQREEKKIGPFSQN